MKRFRNAIKCSALRMLPGTASLSRSSGKASTMLEAKLILAKHRTYLDLP